MPSKKLKIRRKKLNQKINITSMMDMFTIILVFLLKSFSAEGTLVTPAEGLKIPNSNTATHARPALEVMVGSQQISIGPQVVALVPEVLRAKDMRIEPLVQALTRERQKGEMVAKSMGEEFQAEVVIQGDQRMPYLLLTKVMYSCGQAGYPKQNFIVYRQE